MIRGFDEQELDRSGQGRDTELTVSTGMLLALGGGLFLLCGVCFGLGYAIGHRGESASAAVIPPAGAQGTLQSNGSASKPTARAQTPPTPPPVAVAVDVPEKPAQTSATAAEPPERSAMQGQVRPALGEQGAAPQPAQSGPTLHVQPALAQISGWMVQIAAVSHLEDAEVLVNALKKHGYAVAVRRDVSDNLLHVQTGPFVTRNDANAIRQKLLNDGYNAIVQP